MMNIVIYISILLWGLLIALILWVYIKIKDRLDIEELLEPSKEKPGDVLNKEIKRIKENIAHLKGQLDDWPIFFDGDTVGGIARGNEELTKGHLIMAEICFLQDIFKKWDQPNAWVGLAHAYSALKRYEDALDAIKMAIKLDKEAPLFNREGQISVIHAEILIRLRRCQEAVVVLENDVLAINPEFRKAQNLLKECKEKRKDNRQG